ncbi:MAG: LytTR family DNA-binding domain-containing protein [Catalinimonas sp.]
MSKTTYDCIIVDDDESVRFLLKHYVGRNAALNLKASFDGGEEGLKYLFKQPVDLLFLDVEMPGMTGIELLRRLPEKPDTILITAHEGFAVDAFDLRVTDYLVKPVDYERFERAVKRSLENIDRRRNGQPDPNELFVKVNSKMVRLELDKLLYVEALSDYVILVTPEHKHIIYSTMKAIDSKLTGERFMRIHRSYIVNLRKIEAVEDNSIVIQGKHLPISKTYQSDFFSRLNRL